MPPFLGLRIVRAISGVVAIASTRAALPPLLEVYLGQEAIGDRLLSRLAVALIAWVLFLELRTYVNYLHQSAGHRRPPLLGHHWTL